MRATFGIKALGERRMSRWEASVFRTSAWRLWTRNLCQRKKLSHIGEMILTVGDHELKVVVYAESALQEHEMVPPSKRF